MDQDTEFHCCRACDRAGRTLREQVDYHLRKSASYARLALMLAVVALVLLVLGTALRTMS